MSGKTGVLGDHQEHTHEYRAGAGEGAPRYCCAVRLNLSSAALLCEGANS